MTLVDLPSELDDAPPGDALLGLLYGGRGVKRLDVGVYETHYAFNLELKGRGLLVSEYPFDAYMDLATPDERVKAYVAAVNDKTLPSESYGVCDSWEQVIQKWPLLATMDRNLVLAVSPVVRAEEPSDGGWRWHKWGEYIGTHEIKHEYLHDETGIDVVYCYHLYEVRVAE